MKKEVLLTFDIEEFDMPHEYGASISIAEQLHVSTEGTLLLLDILAAFDIPATFFSTVIFAENNTSLIRRILDNGHELASHSYYHSQFQSTDLLSSKLALEKIAKKRINGFRMPRMMPVDSSELHKAGYTYNSSINPVYIPGRYNNFHLPRTIFEEDGLAQFPASASPLIRFPLFWLSFHLVPQWFFQQLCHNTIKKDGYLNLYFHPWEFVDLSPAEFHLPKYLTYNTGKKMADKFRSLLAWMKSKNFAFTTMSAYLADHNHIARPQE